MDKSYMYIYLRFEFFNSRLYINSRRSCGSCLDMGFFPIPESGWVSPCLRSNAETLLNRINQVVIITISLFVCICIVKLAHVLLNSAYQELLALNELYHYRPDTAT
jgi:hypothetical protein